MEKIKSLLDKAESISQEMNEIKDLITERVLQNEESIKNLNILQEKYVFILNEINDEDY